MNSSFNSNRQHQLFLQKQQLQRRHNQEVANAREATHEAQDRAEAAHEQAQGRYGDTVFRTVPLPPAPPPRQRAAAHRGEVRPPRADGKEEEENEEPIAAESAERREGPGKEPVEATDQDGESKHQHHGGSHSGNDQAGGFSGQTGGQSGGHSGGGSGGHAGGGGHSGGQSGSGGQGSGQNSGQSHHGAAARFGAPAAARAVSLPSLAASQSSEVQAFRSALGEMAQPERRARHLAEAMVALSKPGPGRLNNDAMMMSLMAAYIESTHEPGALSTLARVKQVLVEMGPTLTGALPPGPRERNRLALLPLKLLVCDRQRTEAQRKVAVERLRAGQRWPADTIELPT